MKKKIISLFTVLCLMIPCFFAVACKDKGEDPKGIEAYTYSVTLKNAKGLIDENALQSEYDYGKQEDVSWTSSGNDYTISVTRNNILSGDLAVSLLEGYDYSNVSLTVNNKSETGSVVSGSRENCENEAYLTDRQFIYSYEEMKKDTTLVVDFSDCAWAKVSVDFSELSSQGITAYTVADKFVTASMEKSESMNAVQNETVSVDYGTIFAFDCGQKVVFKPSSSENFENLTYSKYTSKYYLSGSNMIQYFTAKKDGECQVYDASKDYSKRGTLRILGCADTIIYNSFDAFETSGTPMTPTVEKELYGTSMFKLGVVNASRLFVELSGDALNYNYYLTDCIDTELKPTLEVEQLTLAGTETVYLDINLTNSDGTPSSAKYLIRKPKNEANYFIVCTDEQLTDNTRISNADYILIGSQNKPSIADTDPSNIYYGFSKTSNGGEAKNVEIEASAYTSDTATDFVLENININISTEIIYADMPEEPRTIDEIFQEPLNSSIFEVECYDESDVDAYYKIKVAYRAAQHTGAEVILNSSDLTLYAGEKILYTTDINNPESWEILTPESVLVTSNSVETSRTIYYYFVSDRADAFLQIQNPEAEVVSVTSVLRDCFGRPMTGTVVAHNTTINLSNVRYLDIKPGSYSSYEAKLLREYDRENHNIVTSNIEDGKIMVSVNGYTTDGSSFKDIKTIDDLKIRYNGFGISGSIYYYINSDTNEYLILRDSQGNIVSLTSLVRITNQSELLINGEYVYCLSLVGGYYAENETFTIELVDSVYGLQYDLGGEVEIFATSDVTGEPVERMVLNQEYYFVGTDNKIFAIIDEETSAVVVDFIRVADIDETTSVYKFTLTFPSNVNYSNGTVFTLRVLNA